MNANEAVSKIRLLLGLNEATFTFATAVLVDGSEVKTEGEMVEGASLMVVTPEGDVPCPAGIHETDGGLLITIDEAGTITAIEEKAAETAPEEAVTEEVALQRHATIGLLTDASYVQLVGEGVACVDVAWPTRYTHSGVEVCSLDDLEGLKKLLIGVVEKFPVEESFSRG